MLVGAVTTLRRKQCVQGAVFRSARHHVLFVMDLVLRMNRARGVPREVKDDQDSVGRGTSANADTNWCTSGMFQASGLDTHGTLHARLLSYREMQLTGHSRGCHVRYEVDANIFHPHKAVTARTSTHIPMHPSFALCFPAR